MRSLMVASSALALLTVTCFVTPPAYGQNDEKVKFDTIDQVSLQGIFYPSPKGKKAPVVMLLHKIGGSSTQDGWGDLAVELQKKDFAVLLFDFRGHGNSTTVTQGFWQDKINVQQVRTKNFNPQRPPESISFKDFTPAYYPQLINDIAAAKTYLDKRNDSGDCNSSNLIVIGAEDGATLGMSWIYSEMHRYRRITPFMRANTCEGNQVAAAIWLSIAPKIGNQQTPLTAWTKYLGQEKNVPMAFVYGGKSPQDTQYAKALLDLAKGRNDNNKWTGEMAIKDTELKGHGLLSNKLNTQSWITAEYLAKLMKEKAMPVWEERDFKKSAYMWDFNKGSYPSKLPDEDTLYKMPLDVLFSP